MPEPRALDAVNGILARRGLQPEPHTPAGADAWEAQRLAEIAEDQAQNRRAIAAAYCDRHIPPRWADAIADHPAVTAWITGYLADPRRTPSLLLHGNTGTGKTHQGYGALRAIGNAAIVVPWVATTTANLYAAMRPRKGVDTEAEFERYAGTPLLLLDDLGAAKASEWTEEVTYRLIDHRYGQCLPSIFTTNLLLRMLRDNLGDRTASRLMEMTTPVELEGADRRAASIHQNRSAA